MNGAILKPELSGVSVYPEVRFANEDASGNVYPDLVDLDHDALSTESEMKQCLAERTKYHRGEVEYCSQPILSDSDEFLYQDNSTGKGNYQSRFSHIVGNYKHNLFGPYDGNKDINSNGQLDKRDN